MPFHLIVVPLAVAAKLVLAKLGVHHAVGAIAAHHAAGAVAAHHAAGAAFHHAAVATAAHPGCHAVLQGGAHFAQITVNAALPSGSNMITEVSIISPVALSAMVLYRQVEKYRALNHLDENGEPKTEFRQIEKCNSCSCSDFVLGSRGSDTTYCVCGHTRGGHSHSNDSGEEFRLYARTVGINTAESTFAEAIQRL